MSAAPSQIDPEQVASIRAFNRFYTRAIGTLNEGLLDSALSLAEARVLYEIATRSQPTASEIASALSLDMGYVSRILRSFLSGKLVTRKTSVTDARQAHLSLTPAGRKQFATLNYRSDQQVHQWIAPLNPDRRTELVRSMASIESLLSPVPSATASAPYILRGHRPGDMGWVIERHATLYAEEYGWDERFEGMVARIAADFIDHFDPRRERCWIADRAGERLACAFLVRDRESRKAAKNAASTARLRMLLVDPKARGLGLGRTLIRECTQFARDAGYLRITLWTNSILEAARHLYESEGYVLTAEKPHRSFGKDLVGQTFELTL